MRYGSRAKTAYPLYLLFFASLRLGVSFSSLFASLRALFSDEIAITELAFQVSVIDWSHD
jgi:hypothetical protein